MCIVKTRGREREREREKERKRERKREKKDREKERERERQKEKREKEGERKRGRERQRKKKREREREREGGGREKETEREGEREKETKQSRGTRLSADWILTQENIEFCNKTRPDLNPIQTACRFRDYWTAQPGAKGVKLDWDATWRNWVRAERSKDTVSKPQALVGWK